VLDVFLLEKFDAIAF